MSIYLSDELDLVVWRQKWDNESTEVDMADVVRCWEVTSDGTADPSSYWYKRHHSNEIRSISDVTHLTVTDKISYHAKDAA